MAVYRTLEPRVHERMADSANVRKTLTEMGAVLSENFESIGVPFINFGDSTRKQGEAFDPAHFKGKLVLGGAMNNSDIMHAPSGPCRITIIRSGPGEDECGKIVVGTSDLIGTAMVSYVGITIGDRVHLEPRVTIMDSGGHPADRRLKDCPENRKSAPIVIEDDAWIGYGATIMPGVTIGHHAIVAPGSVVMWSVPAHGAVMGNPAKSSKVYRKYLEGQQAKE